MASSADSRNPKLNCFSRRARQTYWSEIWLCKIGSAPRRAPVGTALFLGVLVAACLVYPVRNYVQLEIRAGASESASTASQASIDAGYRFTCIVQDGGVQCWGRNSNGELGDGSTTDRSRAVTVLTSASPSTPLTGVTAIASGRLHACALTSAGGVKCWGYNNFGQLGDGTTTNRNVATDVSGLTSGVAAIAAGQNHTCARLTVGTVKCWGSNNQGQLGTGNQADSSTPVSVSSIAGAVLIAAGQQHTCASTSDGAMKCWGYGMNYQSERALLRCRRVPQACWACRRLSRRSALDTSIRVRSSQLAKSNAGETIPTASSVMEMRREASEPRPSRSR